MTSHVIFIHTTVVVVRLYWFKKLMKDVSSALGHASTDLVHKERTRQVELAMNERSRRQTHDSTIGIPLFNLPFNIQ